MDWEEEHVLHRGGLLCLKEALHAVLGWAEEAESLGNPGGVVGRNRLGEQRIAQLKASCSEPVEIGRARIAQPRLAWREPALDPALSRRHGLVQRYGHHEDGLEGFQR